MHSSELQYTILESENGSSTHFTMTYAQRANIDIEADPSTNAM
jgi:hypothetical protein